MQTMTRFILPFCILTALCFYVQTRFLFSPDVSYLLHVTQQFLAGGQYGKDFFETNPPLIFYLYSPVVLLAKWTSIGLFNALQCYVYALMFISSAITLSLLKKIMLPRDKFIAYALTYMMIIAVYFSPLMEMAQREMLMFLFTMPYFFLTVARLEQKSVAPEMRIFIGLFAGLGFALKPFFLISLVLVELYVIVKKQRLFAFIRLETIMIAAVILAYVASVKIFHPEYFAIVMPLLKQYYFISIKEPWASIFAKPLVDFSVIPILFYVLFYRQDRYYYLSTVLMLAMLGMIASYLYVQASWFYHIMPAFGCASLLVVYYFSLFLVACVEENHEPRTMLRDMSFLTAFFVVICIVPIYSGYQTMINRMNVQWRSQVETLADFINSQPGEHSFLGLGEMGTADSFPLTYMTHSEYAGRFPYLWWYAGVKMREQQAVTSEQKLQIAKDKKFLIDSEADDLNNLKARWLIVNSKHIDGWRDDFVKENKKFARAFRHYHLVKTISAIQIFERNS